MIGTAALKSELEKVGDKITNAADEIFCHTELVKDMNEKISTFKNEIKELREVQEAELVRVNSTISALSERRGKSGKEIIEAIN